MAIILPSQKCWFVHDDVITWKHCPRKWPFVRGIHRSPVKTPYKSQWRGAWVGFFYLCLNQRLSKQSWGWWFETPSRPLWRHINNFPTNPRHTRWYCHLSGIRYPRNIILGNPINHWFKPPTRIYDQGQSDISNAASANTAKHLI